MPFERFQPGPPEPFQRFQPGPSANVPNTPGYDWRQVDAPRDWNAVGDGVYAIGAGIRRWRAIGVTAAAAKATANTYEHTGDAVHAAQIGANAFARWMVWVFLLMWAMFLSCFTALFLAYGPDGLTWATAVTTIVAWPFAFGVTWCRNVDFCLFRRGMWYRLFQPIARRCEQVNMMMLYCTLLPALFLWWEDIVAPWFRPHHH